MSAIDLMILLAYFVLLVVIGVVTKRRIKNNEDAVVAGKSLGLWPAAIGKAANICGGSTTVGGAAWGYSIGVTGSWFGIGTMLATFIFVPIAKKVKRIADKMNFITIGDFLQYRYGKSARIIAGGLNAVAFAGFVASQIVATGAILAVLTGWTINFSMVVSTAVVLIYTLLGGLYAIVYTDILQLIIIYVGMVFLALPIGIAHAGGWSHFWTELPAKMVDLGGMGWSKIIALLISTTLASIVLQSGFGYAIACKNEKVARDSNWVSGLLYIVPAITAIIIGLLTLTLYPGLKTANQSIAVYMTQLMPLGVSGLLLAAIIASTMSTSSTCAMMSATCFVQDFYKEFISPQADGKKMLFVTRIVLTAVIIIALIVSIYFPDIIGLILWGYALAVGGLLAPILACLYWKRATAPAALTAMIAGGSTQLYLTIIKSSVQPLLVSLPISIAFMIIISYLTAPPDPEKVKVFFED